MLKYKSLAIVLLFFSRLFLSAGEPWKIVKQSDGITVYSQMDRSSSIKIIKVEAETYATFSAMISLIDDAPNQKNWVYGCTFAEILKKLNDTDWYFYSQTDAPWPITDRDVVSRVHISQNPLTKTVTIQSVGVPDFIPNKPNFVRVPELFSLWTFKALPSGKKKVSFLLKINIGGIIPQWVTNMFISKGPYNTMQGFLFEIEKPKYKESNCPFITEVTGEY